MKHIKGLDTLRAFAIIIVIYTHWTISLDTSKPVINFIYEYLVPSGHAGVDLFFVLSGFLITTILLQAKGNENDRKLHIIKNFTIRRALRIFPIYYLMVFLLLFIGYAGVKENLCYFLTYTSNILFFNREAWVSIGHTWSLAVEEQFYLFWPWLILFIKNKYLKYLFIGSILLSTLFNFICYYYIHKGIFPVLVFNCLECFGLGGFYAFVRMDKEKCRQFEKWLLPVFAIALIVCFRWNYIHDYFWDKTQFLFKLVDGIISLQFIVFVLNNKTEWVRRYILENRVLNYIGKISYGIYLFHEPFQPLYDGFIGRLMTKHPELPIIINDYYFSYLVKLILLVLICGASYKWIELPILSLKNRFKY